ncbi:hypothetical protein O181_022581 [Austropuccinia psidii MF-1]|uniref:Uncharacterized protein n=1 Tax=Austropuccinia psidii MF-1 TaxID=1389203 RepID=A0A9Q3CD55_9BASI|nr:hypothetical protein [Austropuccinia psidii MF-1]
MLPWNLIPGTMRVPRRRIIINKKIEASKSSFSHNKNSSSSSDKKKDLRGQRRNKPRSSLLNRDHRLMGSEKERRIKEGLCAYLGGRNSLEACVKNPQNQVTQPEGRFTSQVEA